MSSITLMIIAGIASAISFFILCWKLDIRKVCAVSAYADIAVTVFLMMIFQGTFSGMIAAVIGGLVFSLLLAVTRYYTGALKLKLDNTGFYWRLTL